MTFTPQVLTQTDNNNSSSQSSSTSFNGLSTVTTGFNTLILTIQSDQNSSAGGIQIQFSDDNTSWITPYTDTYFATNIFTKNYLIIKKYYKVNYSTTSATFTITSRLSTDLDSSITQNNSITVFDNNFENTLDAFGKLRVTEPNTLLDIRFPGQTDGSANFLSNSLQICSALGNSAGAAPTGTYQNSKLIINMPFTGTSSKYYISQSRTYCTYQPGKSLLIMGTGVFDPAGPGANTETFKNSLNNSGDTITSRIGYYDFTIPISSNIPVVRNGLFFQINYNNTSGNKTRTASFNIQNDTLTSIPQTSWNIDKMDGTGPSGLNLDFTKAQLLVIDMEWLGVGRVRFGFYAYGRIQYCHQILNLNSLIQPYTNSINLPICYSLCGTSAGSSFTGYLTQICSTVISEGGYNPSGKPFNIFSSSIFISDNVNANTETPILFLRGGTNNYYHQKIIPSGLAMICTDAANLILFRVIVFQDNASLASSGTVTPTWLQVNSNSVAQYATAYTGGGTFSSSNGLLVDSGYFYGKGSNTFSNLNDIFNSIILQLNSNISNISDVLVISATFVTNASGSKATVYCSLNWQEIY